MKAQEESSQPHRAGAGLPGEGKTTSHETAKGSQCHLWGRRRAAGAEGSRREDTPGPRSGGCPRRTGPHEAGRGEGPGGSAPQRSRGWPSPGPEVLRRAAPPASLAGRAADGEEGRGGEGKKKKRRKKKVMNENKGFPPAFCRGRAQPEVAAPCGGRSSRRLKRQRTAARPLPGRGIPADGCRQPARLGSARLLSPRVCPEPPGR